MKRRIAHKRAREQNKINNKGAGNQALMCTGRRFALVVNGLREIQLAEALRSYSGHLLAVNIDLCGSQQRIQTRRRAGLLQIRHNGRK